jgi:hypothetical protein
MQQPNISVTGLFLGFYSKIRTALTLSRPATSSIASSEPRLSRRREPQPPRSRFTGDRAPTLGTHRSEPWSRPKVIPRQVRRHRDSPSLARVERVILVLLRIVPTVLSEVLHRERIGGPRFIDQGTNAVVYVGLDDDVFHLCLRIGESNRPFACLQDLIPLFWREIGHRTLNHSRGGIRPAVRSCRL